MPRGVKSHGHTRGRKVTPTFSAWSNMLCRCKTKHYCKRGITVCDRWKESFENFIADMGERPPGKGLYTLERENNSKGYEPNNCKWATWREQGNNRITNIRFTYRGVEYTLADLARATGASKETLRSRLCRSRLPWTVEGAVSTPKLTRASEGFYC